MDVIEIFADDAGETHFRRTAVPFELRDFAPPSPKMGVSPARDAVSALFVQAPVGWDTEFHATPRYQYAVLVDGEATVTVTDGETIRAVPGTVLLFNDMDSKGHLTQVQGGRPATFLMIALG